MTALRPPTPVSVPSLAAINAATNGVEGAGVSDVAVGVTNNTTDVDTKPEARQTAPGAAAAPAAGVAGTAAAGETPAPTTPAAAAKDPALQGPLPTNHQQPIVKKSKKQLKKEEEFRKKQEAAQQAAPAKPADQKPPQ